MTETSSPDTPPHDDPPPDAAPPGAPGGYGRPPRHRRFRPGQSGNPKGRPKGVCNLATLLEAELRRPVTVTEGGRTRRVPKAAAMVASQVDKAMKGDTRAFATVLQATTRRPRGEPGGGPDGDGSGPGAAGPGAAGGEAAGGEEARDRLLARLDGLARRHAEDRDRLAAALAAAGLAEAHLEILFGPPGERLRDATTAALRDAQARGFDVQQVAAVAVFAAVAGECAEALLEGGREG